MVLFSAINQISRSYVRRFFIAFSNELTVVALAGQDGCRPRSGVNVSSLSEYVAKTKMSGKAGKQPFAALLLL